MEKYIYHANTKQKKYGIVILITDKINFKGKVFLLIEKDYFVVLKVFSSENCINLKLVCAFNIYNTSTYIMKKMTELEEKIEKSIIFGDFNTQLSVTQEDIEDLNCLIKKLDL